MRTLSIKSLKKSLNTLYKTKRVVKDNISVIKDKVQNRFLIVYVSNNVFLQKDRWIRYLYSYSTSTETVLRLRVNVFNDQILSSPNYDTVNSPYEIKHYI